MRISTHVMEQETVFNGLADSGERATVVIPHNPFAEGSSLSKSIDILTQSTLSFCASVTHNADQYQPAARTANNRAAAASTLSKPFVAVQTGGRDELININARKQRAITIEPANEVSTPIRNRARERFDAAPNIAEKAKLALAMSREELAGIIEFGAHRDVPDDVRSIITDRYATERHIAVTGLQADYQKQPTLEDPFATGPDVEAATRAAQQAVSELNSLAGNLDNVRTILRGVVAMVALATDLPVDSAYRLLTTGKLAA